MGNEIARSTVSYNTNMYYFGKLVDTARKLEQEEKAKRDLQSSLTNKSSIGYRYLRAKAEADLACSRTRTVWDKFEKLMQPIGDTRDRVLDECIEARGYEELARLDKVIDDRILALAKLKEESNAAKDVIKNL